MGRKRFSVDSKLQPNKRAKGFIGDDDRISQLPDEILVDILSSLSLEEAARTSVLSFRWINLWKQTQSLNFDAESTLDMIGSCRNLELQAELLAGERRKYIKWVNRILRSHKSAVLKEFIICFDFSRSAKIAINKWVAYAFARRVERLEIDLTSTYPFYTRALNYAFPQELLKQSNPVVEFKSLKALLLKRVNVTGEEIEFFLRNCPLLEELIVHDAKELSIVDVCGSSLKLKHLEICHCLGVRSIKVSAPNLISLGLTVSSEILIENVPRLANITLSCGYSETCVKRLSPAFSCCISQLETLTLELCWLKDIERCEFPNMTKLKKLVIECERMHSDSLLGLTAWIRESPHLEEFVLKSGTCITETPNFVYGEVEDNIWPPHHHLKEVEFFGFCGRGNDVELVRYFFRNCVVLEKVIINCHHRPLNHLDRLRALPSDLAEEQIARNRARQQLESEVPHDVELVIL